MTSPSPYQPAPYFPFDSTGSGTGATGAEPVIAIPHGSLDRIYLAIGVPAEHADTMRTLGVQVAVIAKGTEATLAPGAVTWHPADWAPDAPDAVEFRIGPGTPVGVLPVGHYTVYARIAAANETPKRRARGALVITPAP